MHRLISVLFAIGLAANGIFMLASPFAWYGAIPGVSDTGPFNAHFVRDIGCAFLVTAIAFGYAAADRERARPATLVGATFLCLHALVHFVDLAVGREDPHHLITDLPAIFLPAVLGLWLARAGEPARKARRRQPASAGSGIVARLAEPKLAMFENDYAYDTTYLRQIARVSGGAFLRFFAFSVFAEQREEAPVEALFATKLAALMGEDCGPCTQLVVRMAERSDVSRNDIRGAVTADDRAMSTNAALAVRFTNAVLARDVEASKRLRGEVVERWGERGLVTIAFAIAAARVYPTLKYALGHGQACSRVRIGEEHVVVAKRAVSSVET